MQSGRIYHKMAMSKSQYESNDESKLLTFAGAMSAAAIVFLHFLLFCIAIHNAI